MDRKERYVNELEILKTEAIKTIDAIKNSENLLHDITKSSIDEMKSVYIEEAKKFMDRIRYQRLDRIKEEESKPGSMIFKAAISTSRRLLTRRSRETESDRRLVAALDKSYREDDIKRAAVEYASEEVKRRVEDEVLGMSREEFLKTLKGARFMRRMLKSKLDEESGQLYQVWMSS